MGYNQTKRARPSHLYRSYLMAEFRLALEGAEVASGNEHTGKQAAPGCARYSTGWEQRIGGRLADPDRHREAMTSRPLLLEAIEPADPACRQTMVTLCASIIAPNAPSCASPLRSIRTEMTRQMKLELLQSDARFSQPFIHTNDMVDTTLMTINDLLRSSVISERFRSISASATTGECRGCTFSRR